MCAPMRRLQPAEPLDQLRWWHHGSSISHCIEAATPRGVWPVAAADQLSLDVTNLGFAANAHLDPFTARAMRDSGADLFSLKIGINIVGGDTMKRRTFVPAVHGFLDTIREGAPSAPILVISPIFCPMHEDTPGPDRHRPRDRRAARNAEHDTGLLRTAPHPALGPRDPAGDRPDTRVGRPRPLLPRRAGPARRGRSRGAARWASSQSCRVPADRRAVRGFVGRLRVDLPSAIETRMSMPSRGPQRVSATNMTTARTHVHQPDPSPATGPTRRSSRSATSTG